MNRLNDSEQNRLREWDAKSRKSEMEQEVKKQQGKAQADATKAQREEQALLVRRIGGNEQLEDIVRKGGRMPDPNLKESRDNEDRYYQERDEMKKKAADASDPNKSKFMNEREKYEKLNAVNNWSFKSKFTPLPYSS